MAFEPATAAIPLPAGYKYRLLKWAFRHDGAGAWPIVVGLDEPRGTRRKTPGPYGLLAGPVKGPEFCECCEHRSPPAAAAAVGERDRRLGAACCAHAAVAAAINLDPLWYREPSHLRQVGVTKGGTAHLLFVAVKHVIARNDVQAIIGK
jgi:hypothetical protein